MKSACVSVLSITNRVVFLGMAVPFNRVLGIEFLAQKPRIINSWNYLVETVSLYTLTFITWFQSATFIRPAKRKGIFHLELLSNVLFSSHVRDNSTSRHFDLPFTADAWLSWTHRASRRCLSAIWRATWSLLVVQIYSQRVEEYGDVLVRFLGRQAGRQAETSPEKFGFLRRPL